MSIIPTDKRVKPSANDAAPLDSGPPKAKPIKTIKLNKAGDVYMNSPSYDDIKEEEQRKNSVAMLFGRMNPPTKGHEENIEGLKSLAKEHNADHVVIASHSHDGEKNPLSPEQKLKHLKRAFPGTNIITSSKSQPTILHHAAELHRQGYRHLIVTGGGDRAEEYHKLLNKYNGVAGRHGHYNFDSITVKSTGERKEGVSGSDMRKHVKSGNFEKFRAGLPSKIREHEGHSRELFNDVKGGLHEHFERANSIVNRIVGICESRRLDEVFLHDPDTYLRMATQAREQGKILRAALFTRIASAVRRRDTTSAMALRNDLPRVHD